MSDFLQHHLQKRISENALRKLSVRNYLLDFCSNDYLGFAKSEVIFKKAQEFTQDLYRLNGSTGSRLISGNTYQAEMLEKQIAEFHKFEAALIFNSGYDANVGLFSSVPQRNDTVIYDERIHASIKDGIRLSAANKVSFKHNTVSELEKKIKAAKGRVFVAVESVYSMDGDLAPLREISEMCQKYTSHLIVDEAHSNGIYGKNGSGLCSEYGITETLFAGVFTFGKALGCHGAAVCGSHVLREYLINFARSFVYTTAMPVHSLHTIRAAYEHLPDADAEREKLFQNIRYYNSYMKDLNMQGSNFNSAIQYIECKNNEHAILLSKHIQNLGFDVRPILSPTVPEGNERLRICLHAYNEIHEIKSLLDHINTFKNE